MPGCQRQQCGIAAVTWPRDHKKSLWHKTRTEGTPSVPCSATISDHAARVFLGLSPSSMPLVPMYLERGAGALLFGEKGRRFMSYLGYGSGVSHGWKFGQPQFIRPNVTEQIMSTVNVRVGRIFSSWGEVEKKSTKT